METSQKIRLSALASTAILLFSACSSDSSSPPTSSATQNTTQDTSQSVSATPLLLETECPETIVIQTDWFPQAEHGALYNLVGSDYAVDTAQKSVSGTLVHQGQDTGVSIEIRVGGPAIGWSSPAAQMLLDPTITLAYDNTDSAILAYDSAPTLAVIAPLEVNPQYIQWDPATYPEVTSISDIGQAGIVVNSFGGAMWADVLTAQGILSTDQIDPSYDGSPARFVAEQGQIAQQGFITAEPYMYENAFEEWGRPVAGQTLHDAGYEIYAGTLTINPSRRAELDSCLQKLVPVIQQSIVDYPTNFEAANDIIVNATEQYADAWTQSRGLTDWSVTQQVNYGIIGNGPNSTVGDFDLARQERLATLFAAAGLVPESLQGSSDLSVLWTNDYIDPSIGF